MMSLTHMAFSTSVTALALCTYDPGLLIVSAIASQLPDLDTPNSRIGRILAPVSAIVSKYGHRQITHSLLGTAIAWAIFLPLLYFGHLWYWSAALGYLSGWLLDAASKTGVPIFYPSPKRGVFPLDPEFRIRTGSTVERLFQAIVIAILVLVVSVNMSGGALASFSNLLGSSTGAVEAYHHHANEREVYAVVTGTHRITQEAFKEKRMKAIGTASESDIIASDGQHLYRVGTGADAQIRTTRVQVELGKAIAVRIQPVQIPDPTPLSELLGVMGADSFATGELLTDEGALLSSQSDPRYFQAVAVQHTGGTVGKIILESATKKDLRALPDIFVKGSVVVRSVK